MKNWKKELSFFSSASAGGGGGGGGGAGAGAGAGASAGDSVASTCRTVSLIDYVNPRRRQQIVKNYGIMLNDVLDPANSPLGICYFVRFRTIDDKSLTVYQHVNKDLSSAHLSLTDLGYVTYKEPVGYDSRLTLGGEVYLDADKNITFWHYKSGNYGSRATDPRKNPGFPADKFVHFSVIDALDKFAIKYKLDSYLHLLIKLNPDTPHAPYFWNPIGDAFCERITSVSNEEDQRAVVDALIKQYDIFYENFEKLPSTGGELLELTRVFQIATFRAETSTDIDCSRNASELRAVSPLSLMLETPRC